jgi:hypothetical protein
MAELSKERIERVAGEYRSTRLEEEAGYFPIMAAEWYPLI